MTADESKSGRKRITARLGNSSDARDINSLRESMEMITSGSDRNILLKPPRILSLEAALEYIEDDEYVEVTPKVVRLRKILLTENERKRSRGKKS